MGGKNRVKIEKMPYKFKEKLYGKKSEEIKEKTKWRRMEKKAKTSH